MSGGLTENPTPSKLHRDYYVYQLLDPRDMQVFYVGKGRGGRVGTHAANAAKGTEPNGAKALVMGQILRAGLEVIESIVFGDLEEQEAFSIERKMISEYRTSPKLTNITGGSLTPEEASKREAIHLLESALSYDEWVSTAPQGKLDCAARVFGSARRCYDWYIGLLIDGVVNPWPLTIKSRAAQ